jgi:hypothetical protein
MEGRSSEAIDLIRGAIAETSDERLWGAVRDQIGHPAALLMLAQIVIALDRIEALLSSD